MYLLGCSDGYQQAGADPVYVLDIISLGAGLAAISSDQSLSLFNPLRLGQGPLKRLRTSHGNIATAKAYSVAESIVATTGENGTVCLWDLRLEPGNAQILELGGNETSLLSLACSSPTFSVSAGTELANHQASVLIWDIRQGSSPRITYAEIHSDDVTELNFHPGDPNILLSGSTDGLVNICDTTITDEDEVVVTAFNHGSVHRAGFLNNTEIFALSHDEKFALYNIAEGDQGSLSSLNMGDAREALGCQYVAHIFPKPNGVEAIIGVGSQSQQMFQLIHLAKTETWGVDQASSVGLPGAHGEEIVRSFCFLEGQDVVFTAGEDGCVKAWRPGT